MHSLLNHAQGLQALTSEGVLMGLLGILGERHLGALQAWPGAGGGGRHGAATLIINAIDVLQVGSSCHLQHSKAFIVSSCGCICGCIWMWMYFQECSRHPTHMWQLAVSRRNAECVIHFQLAASSQLFLFLCFDVQCPELDTAHCEQSHQLLISLAAGRRERNAPKPKPMNCVHNLPLAQPHKFHLCLTQGTWSVSSLVLCHFCICTCMLDSEQHVQCTSPIHSDQLVVVAMDHCDHVDSSATKAYMSRRRFWHSPFWPYVLMQHQTNGCPTTSISVLHVAKMANMSCLCVMEAIPSL